MDLTSTLAARNYTATKPLTQPQETDGVANLARSFAADFAQTLQRSETSAMQAMTGQADPHALVQALAQTELAVEAATTIRDKVIEAYQEILRMPV